jgi:hypothetical protein
VTDERRYDEREVGLILKRVAELHESGGGKADTRAMTEAEIEQVVTELGISRALVSRAVSEIALQDVRNRPVWLAGGKTDLMFEQIVEGEVDDATLGQMIEVLRRYLGDAGELREEAGARIWSTTESRRVVFTVVEHAGKTTLRLEERMPTDAATTVGVSASVGGFVGFLSVIPLKALLVKSMLLLAWGPIVAVTATAGWLAGRALWRRRSTDREEQLRRAFGEILALAGAGQRMLPEASPQE